MKTRKKIITAPLTHETELHERGYSLICGVDEVGRGCIAGPVVACAVIMSQGVAIPGVNDSKQLTPKARAELADKIKEAAVAYALGWVQADEIDRTGIQKATFQAMRIAIDGLEFAPDAVLVDGNGKAAALGLDGNAIIRFIVKGDSASHSIAAASIVAKVERDNEMARLSATYPAYGFDKHKGHGTAPHIRAVQENGFCSLHRKTLLKKLSEVAAE